MNATCESAKLEIFFNFQNKVFNVGSCNLSFEIQFLTKVYSELLNKKSFESFDYNSNKSNF